MRRTFVLLALVIGLLAIASSVAAAVFFSDSFESGDLDAWSSLTVDAGASVDVSTVAADVGTYGLRVAVSTATDDAWIDHGFAVSRPEIYLFARIRPVQAGGGTLNVQKEFIDLWNGATRETGIGVTSNTSGAPFRISRFQDGGSATAGEGWEIGSWHNIELHYSVADSTIDWTIYTDDFSVLFVSNQTAQTNGNITRLQIGLDRSSGFETTVDVDCVIVDNSSQPTRDDCAPAAPTPTPSPTPTTPPVTPEEQTALDHANVILLVMAFLTVAFIVLAERLRAGLFYLAAIATLVYIMVDIGSLLFNAPASGLILFMVYRAFHSSERG